MRRLGVRSPSAPMYSRNQAELRLLGHKVARSTIAKYMKRGPTKPSLTWRAFLKNHIGSLASIDFFVVPTVTFRVQYGFVVLRHNRRQVVHFNVTSRPTPGSVAQLLRHAFASDQAPRYRRKTSRRPWGGSAFSL